METVISADVYIVDLNLRGRTGSRVVEVYLDSDEGLGVDQLASFSREISFLLESADIVKGKYNLNVSSPGADRPLKLPRQFAKHVGRTLEVKTQSDEHVQGKLKAVKDQQVVLFGESGEVSVPFEDIQEAKVMLPW